MEWIIILTISYLASTLSGAAGFGGALLLLPVVTYFLGVKTAVPVLTLAQIFGNASRVWFSRSELNLQPVYLFLSTAIPLSVLGSFLFVSINEKPIKVFIGLLLIALVIYRRKSKKKFQPSTAFILAGGGITGFLSGLAGSAGPLGAAVFLSLPLTPAAYIAGEAMSALALHLTKTIVYNRFSLMGGRELLYGGAIGITMIAGSYKGKKIVEKLDRKKFVLLVEILLILSGAELIFTSLL